MGVGERGWGERKKYICGLVESTWKCCGKAWVYGGADSTWSAGKFKDDLFDLCDRLFPQQSTTISSPMEGMSLPKILLNLGQKVNKKKDYSDSLDPKIPH